MVVCAIEQDVDLHSWLAQLLPLDQLASNDSNSCPNGSSGFGGAG
jgi:hypothetical protein